MQITTKQQLLNGVRRTDLIARSGEHIVYLPDTPGFVLIDHDGGMPAEVEKAGGFLAALSTVLPAIATTAERFWRRSTSAGLYLTDTGERFPGSGGLHLYLTVQDAADAQRFLYALHDRCWLAGFGWFEIGAAGQLLNKSDRRSHGRTTGAVGVRGAADLGPEAGAGCGAAHPRVCGWRPARHGAGMPAADDPRAGGVAANAGCRGAGTGTGAGVRRRLRMCRSGGRRWRSARA